MKIPTEELQEPISAIAQACLDSAGEGVEKAIARNEELAPVLIVGQQDCGQVILLANFTEERKALVPTMIKMLIDGGAEAVVFVVEAWVHTALPGTAEYEAVKGGQAPLLPPRLQADRRDAAMVQLFLPAGRRLGWFANIDQENGKRILRQFAFVGDTAHPTEANQLRPTTFNP